MRKERSNKFEFVFYINENIICQRYFSVRDYNPEIKNSMDIVWTAEECVTIIQDDLKAKCVDYLYNYYNAYVVQTKDQVNPNGINIFEKEDVYDFEIKIDGRSVAKKRFTGNNYPQKVRYSVDIRKLIPLLIRKIQEGLETENLSVEYGGVEL